jgi:hypothetical protein
MFPLLWKSFLVWYRPNFLIFLLLSMLLGSCSKEHWENQCWGVFTLFFSKSFMIWDLACKSLIYFELIFFNMA